MKLSLTIIFAAIIFFDMPHKNDSDSLIPANQTQRPIFSFGIIADVQYCDCEPVGTRFYSSSLVKLREALTLFRNNSTEFIINLGDLIDKDIRSYKPVLDIIDSSGLKIYHITGNHDYSVDSRLKNRIPVHTPAKEGYYSFVHERFRFIFINGNEISTYLSNNKTHINQANNYISSLKSKNEINAVDWNGGISGKQLAWLTAQLNEATDKNENVFLLCHFPVFPDNVHNLLNYKEILRVLEKYKNIIAWFNGHNHAGNYGNFNMIHFFTLKGMVETKENNSFALIEVYNNKIWIKGYGREKNLILAY